MGRIVYWTIIRAAITIPVIWILMSYIYFQFWWVVLFLTFYLVILHPAIMQYKKFEEDNREIIESTLCSSCKSFDKSAVLCIKYDQHPTLENLPCEGTDWEPVSKYDYEEEKQN
jgi:glucan phosphoethanolaminetransferase (alkaline phosphatase superfamily)